MLIICLFIYSILPPYILNINVFHFFCKQIDFRLFLMNFFVNDSLRDLIIAKNNHFLIPKNGSNVKCVLGYRCFNQRKRRHLCKILPTPPNNNQPIAEQKRFVRFVITNGKNYKSPKIAKEILSSNLLLFNRPCESFYCLMFRLISLKKVFVRLYDL